MYLYNLSLIKSSNIQKVLHGSFSNPYQQQIIISRGKILELYQINEKNQLLLLASTELYCIIRSIVVMRLQNSNQDLISLGSDAGKLIIIKFNKNSMKFEKVVDLSIGIVGCRKNTPGQYLAINPQAESIVLGSIQQQKYFYRIKQQNNSIVLSNRSIHTDKNSFCLNLIAIKSKIKNHNRYVSLQVRAPQQYQPRQPHSKQFQKFIVIYEFNTLIQQVQIVEAYEVNKTAYNIFEYNKHDNFGFIIAQQQCLILKLQQFQRQIIIPKRYNDPQNKDIFIINSSKLKDNYYFQNQLGDIFRIIEKNNLLFVLDYFSTVPSCISFCFIPNNLIFCAGQKSDHYLYKIITNQSNDRMETELEFNYQYIKLLNLKVIQQVNNLSCISDMKVQDLTDSGTPQIYITVASSQNSSLTIIKQGLKTNQIFSMKTINANNIWTLKKKISDYYHSIVVLSFYNKTQFYQIKENGNLIRTQFNDIDTSSETVYIGMFYDNQIIHIYSLFCKLFKYGKLAHKLAFPTKILKAVANQTQVIFALAGGQIIYCQLDIIANKLFEKAKIVLQSEAQCVDIQNVVISNKKRAFLSIALTDHSVNIYEIKTGETLYKIFSKTFEYEIKSIGLLERKQNQNQQELKLTLYVGLQNGNLNMCVIDVKNQSVLDIRKRYCGEQAVKCIKFKTKDRKAMFILSSKAWIIYYSKNQYRSILLNLPDFRCASAFSIQNYSTGIIGFNSNETKIINVQNNQEPFHYEKVKLDYTPRKFFISNKKIIILQSQQKNIPKQQQEEEKYVFDQYGEGAEQFVKLWKSQIRIYDPISKNSQFVTLQEDQACISITGLKNRNMNKQYICVGCVVGLQNKPVRIFKQASINIYLWQNQKLTFCHKTLVDDIPYAIHGWKQLLLCGIGNSLKCYQIGKKKILKKAQIKNLSSNINTISTQGQRIFVSTISDSFHLYHLNFKNQTFFELVDDIIPRYITTSCVLDESTIIGGDKFQNIIVQRIPLDSNYEYDSNYTNMKYKYLNSYLNGAPEKFQLICNYFIGQLVTSIQKTKLVSTCNQLLIYCTANGGINILAPIENEKDALFLQKLQILIEQNNQCIIGRTPKQFRSFYSQKKGIIDGNFCELFNSLTENQQTSICTRLNIPLIQVNKKLEEIRNKFL